MITKAAYLERRGASLRALDLEISRFTAYADRATADVSVKYYEAIKALQAARDKAAKRLRDLHVSTSSAWMWEEAAAGMEDVWSELRNAILAAISTTYCEASSRPSDKHALDVSHQTNRVRRIAPRGSCY